MGNNWSHAQLKCGELFPLLEGFGKGLESIEGSDGLSC